VHEGLAHLKRIFEPDDRLYFAFIHGVTEQIREHGDLVMLSAIDDEFFDDLTQLNNKDWSVYVAMAPLTEPLRRKEYVSCVRAAFTEIDVDGDAALGLILRDVKVPPPHIVVESSPHKYQAIWLVEGFTLGEVESINSLLIMRFGGDKACRDVARLLRVSGFKNMKAKYRDPNHAEYKGPEAPLVHTISTLDFRRYRLADFKLSVDDFEQHNEVLNADGAELYASRLVIETALREAEIPFTYYDRASNPNFYCRWEIKCPNEVEHSDGGAPYADVLMQRDGQLAFKCFHGHCSDLNWKWFREHLEELIGHRLSFDTDWHMTADGRIESI
jgi:hypothetical protein